MLVGAVVAVVLSQCIGYPVFRLRGHYFAIATIAVGEIIGTFMINWDWAGGARGLFVPIKRPDSWVNFQFHESKQNYYYIALGLLLLALWITRRVERSRLGYYLRAIREDQDAAASLGIPVAAYKQRAMALSAGWPRSAAASASASLHRPRIGFSDGVEHLITSSVQGAWALPRAPWRHLISLPLAARAFLSSSLSSRYSSHPAGNGFIAQPAPPLPRPLTLPAPPVGEREFCSRCEG
jgi:branched-subunit amino acid ABC-type transport system permease component